MTTTLKTTARTLVRGTAFTALAILTATACDNSAQGGAGAPEPEVAPVTAPVAPSSAAPVVITPRAGTVRLARGAHPLARPELDEGRLDPAQRIPHLSMFFSLSAAQKKDRDALAQAQLDPHSPSYHRWLNPESYRERFGASQTDIDRAIAWLSAQGFDIQATSRLGTRVSFGGTVAQLEAAFQTEMHYYRVGNETHYAMATAPALPEDLASIVLGIHNTHNFWKKPVSRRTNAGAAARAVPAPDYTITFPAYPDASLPVLGPRDWASAYDVAPLYDPGIGGKKLDGTGVTIGIVGTAAVASSDLAAFRKTFGLPAATYKMTLVPDTGPSVAGQNGSGLEAILDLEWSAGIAKGASVNYVYVGQDALTYTNDVNVDDATFYIIEQNLADVMSESYGGCEAAETPSDADLLDLNGTAANLQGITYMASSGDDGAADCVEEGFPGLYVDVPGAYPGVTSVGGTEFPTATWTSAGALIGYPFETVWNEQNDPYATVTYMGMTYSTSVRAGGGGISQIFSRPAYQASLSACDTVGSLPTPTPTPMRQVPDVAVSAALGTPGYYVECTFDQKTQDCAATGGTPFGTPVGGTSAASPSFAGVVAILNQAVGERLGNINPFLYNLASLNASASPFHDITSGTNEIACGVAGAGDAGQPDGDIWPDAGCGEGGLYGYAAAPGYDCASGIGSIDGVNLAEAWLGAVKTDTALVPTPDSTTEGAPVTLSATVTVPSANDNALTGTVDFYFETYTASGALDLSWDLGSVAITDGTVSNGHAVLTTAVPPGLSNPGKLFVNVIAVYGGDTTHLPSRSSLTKLTFAPVSFAINPATITLSPRGTEQFTTTGGIPPVRWYLAVDSTSDMSAQATIGETDGGFVAGPLAGYAEIQALDSYGAEAFAEITVGDPTGIPPWVDAGADAGVDAAVTHDAGHDAGIKDSGVKDTGADVAPRSEDAGTPLTQPGGGGCSCEVAVGRGSESASWGGFGGLVLGLGFLVRRRRSTTDASS